MTALVFGIVHAADAGWGTPLALASIGAGLLLLAGAVGRPGARGRARQLADVDEPRGGRDGEDLLGDAHAAEVGVGHEEDSA
jgi:hypothetical protein